MIYILAGFGILYLLLMTVMIFQWIRDARSHRKQDTDAYLALYDAGMPPYLCSFYEASNNFDAHKMTMALIDNARVCPDRDDQCLSEIFCPDCNRTNGGSKYKAKDSM